MAYRNPTRAPTVGGGGGSAPRRNPTRAPSVQTSRPTSRGRTGSSGLYQPPSSPAPVSRATSGTGGTRQAQATRKPQTVQMPVQDQTQSQSRTQESTARTPQQQTPSTSHYIERGDTVSGIAQAYGVTTQQLIDANPHIQGNPDLIYEGEQLQIPREGGGVTQDVSQQFGAVPSYDTIESEGLAGDIKVRPDLTQDIHEAQDSNPLLHSTIQAERIMEEDDKGDDGDIGKLVSLDDTKFNDVVARERLRGQEVIAGVPAVAFGNRYIKETFIKLTTALDELESYKDAERNLRKEIRSKNQGEISEGILSALVNVRGRELGHKIRVQIEYIDKLERFLTLQSNVFGVGSQSDELERRRVELSARRLQLDENRFKAGLDFYDEEFQYRKARYEQDELGFKEQQLGVREQELNVREQTAQTRLAEGSVQADALNHTADDVEQVLLQLGKHYPKQYTKFLEASIGIDEGAYAVKEGVFYDIRDRYFGAMYSRNEATERILEALTKLRNGEQLNVKDRQILNRYRELVKSLQEPIPLNSAGS